MSRPRSPIVTAVLCAAVLHLTVLGAPRANPGQEAAAAPADGGTAAEPTHLLKYEKGGAGMAIDGLIVRPISFVGTVLGTVVFVVTLPFSAIGGNVGEAAEFLVVEPARFTFTRCLGCFPREE